MATAIVSLAAAMQGWTPIAHLLFFAGVVAYAVVWIGGALRIARSARALAREIGDYRRGPQFMTIVAATCVLGVCSMQFAGATPATTALWLLGCALWMLVTYAFFGAVTFTASKPSIEEGIDGSWLLATVSTESLAVLGTAVAGAFAHADVVIFASLALFLVGAMLYILVIGLILFRWIFRPMKAHALTPTYWINMGAVAITTLAGARLIDAGASYAFVAGITHFLAGFTLFFWAIGTWWIPLLALAFVWRHLHQRIPLRYDPHYWSLVFPLGMYSVATEAYARSNHVDFLLPLARVAAFVALAAWIATAAGLLRELARGFRGVSASR